MFAEDRSACRYLAQRSAARAKNWKRATRWRQAILEIGRPTLRVHDLPHTYASLARRAGADLRLFQKTMRHASITEPRTSTPIFTTTNSTRLPRRWTRSTTPAETFRNYPVVHPEVWPDIGRMVLTPLAPRLPENLSELGF